MKKNARYVLFWIKSSRGTDERRVFEIPKDWTKDEIKSALEHWCSCFGAWTHSDNILTYGYKGIKIPKKPELKKRWDRVCKQKRNALDQWNLVAAMWNVIKVPESWK